ASADATKASEFNRMEKLRDPSHVRAMPAAELESFFAGVGLHSPRVSGYRLEGELESLLGRSFPPPGDADKIREIFPASLADDPLGLPIAPEGETIPHPDPLALL